MALRTDAFDLGGLRLSAGEGRRLELHVAIEPLVLAGERYPVAPSMVPVLLDVSRTTGQGYALRLRFRAALEGPCMRCLKAAAPAFAIDVREVYQPLAQPERPDDELRSPYVEDGVLDLGAWARDALVLALPATLLCRADCAGLCAVCGADLNEAPSGHRHERPPDPRWAALSRLRLD